MQSQTGTRGENYTIDRNIRVSTWWHLSSSMELGMEVMKEVWQASELAKINQQCHVNVMGHNRMWKHNHASVVVIFRDQIQEHPLCWVWSNIPKWRSELMLELGLNQLNDISSGWPIQPQGEWTLRVFVHITCSFAWKSCILMPFLSFDIMCHGPLTIW